MLYQLRNGRTIEITVEQFLWMSDAELESLESTYYGEVVNDPFAISVLHYGPAVQEDAIDDFNYNDSPEDLTNISKEDKLTDDDYIDKDNIEQ